ncbi:MAG: hypothetical protein WD691_02360 [Acidimicrobiales bacterium]
MELLVIAVVAGILWWVLRRRTPSSPPAEIGPVGWCSGTNWRALPPLARAGTRALLRHPAFLAGVALTPLMLLLATADTAFGSAPDSRDISLAIALALVPLAWLTIVAVNLIALRPRRTGTDELFAALPTPQPVRTTALLTAGVGPVIVAAVLTVAWVGVVATREEVRGSPEWLEIAVGPLIVVGAVAVGVAVARWLPRPIFGVLAAIATMFIQARFLDVTTWPWDRAAGDPVRFLGFIAEATGAGTAALEVRPAGWHLLYLVGLVVVMASVALVRDGLRPPIVGVLAVALLVVTGTGWIQIRPLSPARQAEMVSYLTDPSAHQRCETRDGVRYCAYPGFTDAVVDWSERVETTLGVLPPIASEWRGPLEVTQRAAIVVGNDSCSPIPYEASLPPPVAERVSPAALWPADDKVHPGFAEESFPCSDEDVHGFFLAVQVGAWAVGLPPAPHGGNERCTATGQARASVALWAAAAGTPDGERLLRAVLEEGASADGTLITFDGGGVNSGGWDAPPMWGVDYDATDAGLALALLSRPTAEVAGVLGEDWAHWTDPNTSSTELADAAGVGGPADAGAGSGSPCP